MKKTWFLLSAILLSGVMVLTAIAAGNSAASGELVISVAYERQDGPGSNQYAVYIEDEGGEIVRTLYVTKFTADGGYVRRPTCTPMWVNKSRVAEMSADRIDVFSGSTPQSGLQHYTWDLKDDAGSPVDAGTYYFVVEGTYWGENQVLFRNAVTVGGGVVRIPASAEFNSDESKNRGMITEVYAEYRPGN
ncbi:MAG: DUF2271 domain-containing protein [Rikenellaceae bacterium]|nr:DUF2271 domain-containing protein [Rikenellaceae bacterium]